MARRKNPNLVYKPIIHSYEVKNPIALVPINWEERYGEDRVRYEEEPIFDEYGNYIETRTNVYVRHEKVIKWIIWNKNKVSHNIKPLFEVNSERKEEEINEFRY